MRMFEDVFDGAMVLFAIGILLFLIGGTIGGFFVSHVGATHGTHRGVVTAVETNKFIFSKKKAYVKTSAETTQEDQYCVKDEAVYQKLLEASQSGTVVDLTFDHPLVEWTWNCSGESAIIVGVK